MVEEGAPYEPEEIKLLAHELRNTLFATDMLLERALEHEELGTDPMEDVRRARVGIQESLEAIRAPDRRLTGSTASAIRSAAASA